MNNIGGLSMYMLSFTGLGSTVGDDGWEPDLSFDSDRSLSFLSLPCFTNDASVGRLMWSMPGILDRRSSVVEERGDGFGDGLERGRGLSFCREGMRESTPKSRLGMLPADGVKAEK